MSYPIHIEKLQMSSETNLRRLAKYLKMDYNCEIDTLILKLEECLNENQFFIPKNFPRH